MMMMIRDALIRHWPIISRQIIGASRSAVFGRFMKYYKKLILLSYSSYLFRLRLLSEDSYLLEGLQSAEKNIKAYAAYIIYKYHR